MPDIFRSLLCCSFAAVLASACASQGINQTNQLPADAPAVDADAKPQSNSQANSTVTPQTIDNGTAATNDAAKVSSPTRQGQLEFAELTEVSGLAVSHRHDDVLWAINDSGNGAALYALDVQGKHLGKWPVAIDNRDWEDLASIWYNGDAYLLIAETGDNLRNYAEYKIHIVQEPLLDGSQDTLNPLATLSYRYSDGKHNVEALDVLDGSIILISKEPPAGSTHSPGKVYSLPLQLQSNTRLLEANYLTTLATQNASVETRLAAALTGVSLNNVTAMDFDRVNRIAYLLTYRQVIKLPLPASAGNPLEALRVGLSQRGSILYRHALHQAEALAVDSHGQVWITSEKAQAPLWVLPAHQIPN